MHQISRNAQLKIEWVPTASLKARKVNARVHPKAQIKLIADSIAKFGWVNPIITGMDGEVIAGHARLEAALSMKLTTVPTILIAHLSESDRRAYALADNAIAERSGWSKELLRSEVTALFEDGYDLTLLGFEEVKIEAMLSFDDHDQPTNDDDVEWPDAPPTPVSRLGDLWAIDGHKLYVGDARDPVAYDRLLGDEQVQMIITDPPYGCRIENNVSGGGRKVHKDFVAGAGETSLAQFGQTLIRPAFKAMGARCLPGAIAYVFTDWRAAPHMLDAASGHFDEVKQLVVWSKTNAGQGAFYRSAHELIYVFKVAPGDHINNFGLGKGGRYRTNVWTYPGANVFGKGRMADLNDHPTVKNKKMIADAILDCSKRGGIVLDSFVGSGTTLCAAARTGRQGRGIELDPQYADVTLRRTASETGKEPTLEGVPFSDVAARRANEGDVK